MAECSKCGSRYTSTQKAHTFVQMAGGQAKGGVRKRITVLRMEALNETSPVPTIKQKLSVRLLLLLIVERHLHPSVLPSSSVPSYLGLIMV